MLNRLLTALLLAASLFGLACNRSGSGQARYYLLVVWDGMRPDFVTPELTPTLWELRSKGVWFANHHSVYPTATEVNGAVLATGMFPRRTGVLANREFRPEMDSTNYFGTEWPDMVWRGDALYADKYLKVPTLVEWLQTHEWTTAVAGTKGVAFLQDRRPRGSDATNKIVFAGFALPRSLETVLTNSLGAFPESALPNAPRDTWTRRSLTEILWKQEMPRYSVLWLSEPDLSQHNRGPGSPEALQGIRNCDQRLGEVLQELERRQIRNQTDILVVSDHGFSTIAENGDATAALRAAGLNARTNWSQPPVAGDIMAVGNGGSLLLYVIGHNPEVIGKAVTTMQQLPSTGVVFTRDGLPGTFQFSEVMLDSPLAPDIVVSTSWTLSEDGAHPKARITNHGYTEYGPGEGMHVSLGPSDLRNLAVASGPDFKSGFTNSLPSGNIDVVPTLLWLMGVAPPQKLDGRVLSEALTRKGPAVGPAKPGRREAKVELPGGNWEQYLRFTEVNGVRYIEEGNGKWVPTKP